MNKGFILEDMKLREIKVRSRVRTTEVFTINVYQQQTHLKCGLAACEGRRTKATPAGRLKQHKTVWKTKLIAPGFSRSLQMLSWTGTGQTPSRKVRLTFKPQQGQPLLGPKRNLPNGLGAGHEDCYVLGPTEGSAPVCTGFQLGMCVDSKTLCKAMVMF